MNKPILTRLSRRDFLYQVGFTAVAGVPLFSGAGTPAATEGVARPAEHRITDHGARTRRGEMSTEAIQTAIDACHADGGGTVRIPPGRFTTGALRLKSNVRLHLEEGAILQGSNDWRHYSGIVEWPQGGRRQWGDGEWSNAIITALDATNITIDGPGTIDGVDCTSPKGEEGFRGPHAVVLRNCSQISIHGVTIRRAGNYGILCFDSKQAEVVNVKVRGGHDALHTQRCEQFRVRDCDFRTGDDCFAGCDNVDFEIRNCRINSSCNGFRLGCLNLAVKDCELWGPGEYEHKISGRTNMLGAFVHFAPRDRNPQLPSDNWQIENLRIRRAQALYLYDFERGGWQQGQPAKRLQFKNIEATQLARSTRIVGDAERRFSLMLDNVSLSLDQAHAGQPVIEIQQFDTLSLRNVRLANSGKVPVLTASRGRAVHIDRLVALPESSRPHAFDGIDAISGI